MMEDDILCERCGCEFMIRDGDDPTPHCDHCAHELVAELTAERDKLQAFKELVHNYLDAHDIGDLMDWLMERAILEGTK